MTVRQSLESLGYETDSTNKETDSTNKEGNDAVENEEMIGEGDFQGHHVEDPDSNFRKLVKRIKQDSSDPTLMGKILNKSHSKRVKFCCDTGSSCNLLPVKIAALNDLKFEPVDEDEPSYNSGTNNKITILGQTSTFIRLDKVSRPIRLSFLVCEDDGDEALLSLDTLIDLSIVPPDFPCPMDPSIRDHKIRKLQRIEVKKWAKLTERIENLRTQLSFPQENLEEDKEEEKCEELRQAWLEDYQEVFKEDVTIDDRIEMETVRVGLVENHEDIPIPHPKAANDIPAYLREAADRELARMLAGGLIEKVEEYTETVSRGFFVEKKTLPGEEPKVRLVADFRNMNMKLQRPEYPLDNSSAILKRLKPEYKFFGSIDMSSGYSQIPLAEEDRHWFTILLPQGKFRFCVLPQGLSISPELFDIHTAPSIRNTDNCYKNADDILTGGTTLEQLDDAMRRILGVCKDRGIKLAPSKLQVGRRLRWGGVPEFAYQGMDR